MFLKYFILLIALSATQVLARDDGQVRTPPMGWISWLRFQCETDCKKHPNSCINENLYKEAADRLVKDGFKELGYEYVNIDDCWSEMKRDSNNRLVANKERFPNGMKALADYIHSKGLKLGIYGDVGPTTCSGFPSQNGKNGSNYFKIDAQTFAEWGIDSFKFDGCNEPAINFAKLYPEMGKALNESGRKILYSCEWLLYDRRDYDAVAKTCHTSRIYQDVNDGWKGQGYTGGVGDIIKYLGNDNEWLIKYNGPGFFIDPDMLAIGNKGLSYEQSKTQMSLWAMWSSPLMMSNDLRDLKPEFKNILQNKAVIAVDQDKHGIMAKRVVNKDNHQVWVKSMEPIINGVWSYAVVYLDTNEWGNKNDLSYKVSDLIPNLKSTTEFVIHDLYYEEGKEILGTLKPWDQLKLKVAVAGGSRMVKLVPK